MNVEIEVTTHGGEVFRESLTREEFDAWEKYADSHPHLLGRISYRDGLSMFLSHFRRGINLNLPLV